MHRFLLLPLLLMVSLLTACAQRNCPGALPSDYEAQIRDWQQAQQASLSAPQGWNSLIGLYWLKPGENRCGSGPDMDILLPPGHPAWAATYTLEAGKLSCMLNPAAEVQWLEPEHCSMQSGSLIWHVIERGGRQGVRLRDTLRPARIRLRPRSYFPIRADYRVCAQVLPIADQDSILLHNVLDMAYTLPVAAKLRFELGGATHEIVALDGGSEQLFVVLSDETTGETTYGGGRYLYCPRPDAKGRTIIDFNQLYNPPCVFTDYATCLLPPAENHIPLPLEVGEKIYGDH
ncbi:MAG: DUF1684 domain-containing protein [Bacteroidetes bacterium]|nr:MAG: DUF1684 domain-containing protein [Bacteroidota bacterium]